LSLINREGGCIFVGITESGIIKGIYMDRKTMTYFLKELNYYMEKCHPIGYHLF